MLFLHENTHKCDKHSKFEWIRCCHEIPGALVAQNVAMI